MKRILCMILLVIIILLAVFSSSAFTLQSVGSYMSADDSGAYVIDFNGNHATITRYALRSYSVELNLSYDIGSVCAYRGKVFLLCDDSYNNQLIVYVYYPDTDALDSFAVYDVKLYGEADFCCDDNAIYIESHRDNHVLRSYSYSGALLNNYRFDDEVTSLFSGYHSGVYAVSDDALYTLSESGFTTLSGATVEPPLFPADTNIIASACGQVYVCDGSRITRTFMVDTDYRASSACVVDNRMYYPCGSVIYGYDLDTGEKVSYCRTPFETHLLYADGNIITAVGDASYTSVSQHSFTEIKRPDDNGGEVPVIDNPVDSHDNTVSEISSDVYQVDFENYYITGIEPGTTAAQFKRNMNYDGYTLTIYRDGNIRKSGNVGTAMTAVFTLDESSLTFELSVSGDITGEGNRNSRDLNFLMDYLIGSADFNGVYDKAADLSGDGTVDVTDLAILKSLV